MTTLSPKIGVYVRVSTLDQEKGLASQEHAITQYLDGHGLANAKWYRDRLSGATTKRPAFEQLQKDIFNGRVKTVVCWKLDRLSRSLRDGINVLTDWVEKDVRIVAVSQQLDFSGMIGQAFGALLFAVAQMERENLRENTKRGLLKAKNAGVSLGRKRKLDATQIVALLDKGMSYSQVGRELKCSRQSLYNTLKHAGITYKRDDTGRPS